MQMNSAAKKVSLFRNGSNQAIRIPREFELDASEATIRKDGEVLIIEPVLTLSQLLAAWKPLDDADFPDVDSDLPPLEEPDL